MTTITGTLSSCPSSRRQRASSGGPGSTLIRRRRKKRRGFYGKPAWKSWCRLRLVKMDLLDPGEKIGHTPPKACPFQFVRETKLEAGRPAGRPSQNEARIPCRPVNAPAAIAVQVLRQSRAG